MFSFPEVFKARIVELSDLNSNTIKYIFEVIEGKFNYKAGQFVMLNFIDPFDNKTPVSRAYSVASKPSDNKFELCIELIEGGKAGTFLKNVKLGDVLDFKGPFGHCTLPTNIENKEILLVATGTGIAPIKAILEDISDKNLNNKIKLLFGMRYIEQVYYLKEIENFKNTIANLDVKICISKPEKENPHFTGRVSSFYEVDKFNESTLIYACGNGQMVREIRQLALDKNVPKNQILVEIFDS